MPLQSFEYIKYVLAFSPCVDSNKNAQSVEQLVLGSRRQRRNVERSI